LFFYQRTANPSSKASNTTRLSSLSTYIFLFFGSCHDTRQILLIDKLKFRAVRFYKGVLEPLVVSGNVTDAGSRGFISRFLLGAGSQRTTSQDFPYILPEAPLVDELELAVRAAIAHWKETHGMELCAEPVLGMGATGIVLAMNMPVDGHSIGTDGADAAASPSALSLCRTTRSQVQLLNILYNEFR
jgi:hypothetical protein